MKFKNWSFFIIWLTNRCKLNHRRDHWFQCRCQTQSLSTLLSNKPNKLKKILKKIKNMSISFTNNHKTHLKHRNVNDKTHVRRHSQHVVPPTSLCRRLATMQCQSGRYHFECRRFDPDRRYHRSPLFVAIMEWMKIKIN